MSTAVPASPKRKAKRNGKTLDKIGYPLGDRMVRPMPGPGETGCVGLADWQAYLDLDLALERSGFRVRYFRGVIEIMSISFDHEALRGNLGRLIEAFCLWAGIEFQVWGSTTQRKSEVAGGEPDESYAFGSEAKDRPDLVIEVGLTSGGIDKLEFWGELGAKEVWIWQNNKLHGFARNARENYEPITESFHLAGLKLALIQEFALVKPTSKAVREFKAKLEAAR